MQNSLTDKSLLSLEYDKILHLLSEKCSCPDSAHLAEELRPCAELDEARARLTRTSDATRLSFRFGGPSFYGLKNIASSLQRAKLGSSLTMGELLQVTADLAVYRSLTRYRDASRSVETSLDALFDALAPNRYLEDKISAAILSEEEMADNASPALSDIRRHIRGCTARVREQLDKMTRSSTYQKYLQESIVTIRGGRFVVPVKAEYRAEVPGLVHDTSSSGATVFIEPMGAVEANNELKVLYSKEQKEIERILFELSQETGSFADSILQSYDISVELDFIFAASRLALSMKAFAPTLTDEPGVVLNNARHPLLNPEKAVPVSLTLGGEFDTLVITGPNTGGKTVALKTLGLLTLMALSGLMIPADETSSVGFFAQVLADIGDEQSIEQSLSTFSAHMTNIIDIISYSGPQSLVLLDELGSGTDPVEGAALATAILEDLRQRGARIAATTHYAELKIYALETPGVENASCEFDIATLRPTYRLLIGTPGRSNAFAISERLGLSTEIIGRAKELVSSDKSRFEDVVSSLEQNRQQLEDQLRQAASLRAAAERDREEAAHMRTELDETREKELEKAREKARRLLEQSRFEARQLLDELEELKKQRDTNDPAALREKARAQLGTRLKKLEATADPVHKKPVLPYHPPRPFRAGDTVVIAGINKTGVVLTPPDDSGWAEVRAGIIRTRVRAEELRLTEEKEQPIVTAARSDVRRSSGPVKTELDLRGQNAEEGLLELDRFLDDAQLAGLSVATVIHGKGTGVLRNAVQQHLKGHPAVKSFRLGRYGEGESGVTVVELK